jgi:hypothetical protein
LLQKKDFKMFLPGHGGPVNEPKSRLNYLINHRLEREAQIRTTIKTASLSAVEITPLIYTDVDNSLIPAATRNVFAHLIDLNKRGIVEFEGSISENSKVVVLKD